MEYKIELFTGIRPSGDLHLGNLAGMMGTFKTSSLVMIADLHVMTDSKRNLASIYGKARELLALGRLENQKVNVFVQSQNPGHLLCMWRFMTMMPYRRLRTMVNFKSAQDDKNVGLLCYPVLMAADIALYRAKRVPVGEDQRQHVEFYNWLARRVNNRLGKRLLPVLRFSVKKMSKIRDLRNPEIKMSKSNEDQGGVIRVSDSSANIRSKFKRALTSNLPLERDNTKAMKNLWNIANLFWPEGCKILYSLRGSRHFLFKSILGIGIARKIKAVRDEMNSIGNLEILRHLRINALRARILSREVTDALLCD